MQSSSRYRFGPPQSGFRIGPGGYVPPAVRGLIIANVAVYLLQLVTPPFTIIETFGLIPAKVAQGEIWRLFTYQFLHGGVWHIAINMLMLWMFGSELEERWGQRFFLKYYFLCAVAGGAVYTLVRWGTWVPSVGASGAIYGILMAYGMWFPNREVYIWFLLPIRVRYLVLFLIAFEFLQSLPQAGSGIAHAAHLGGMAFGYAYLRWWGASGLGLGRIPSWHELRRAYYRWRFRRLQKRRLGGDRPNQRTYH